MAILYTFEQPSDHVYLCIRICYLPATEWHVCSIIAAGEHPENMCGCKTLAVTEGELRVLVVRKDRKIDTLTIYGPVKMKKGDKYNTYASHGSLASEGTRFAESAFAHRLTYIKHVSIPGPASNAREGYS